MFKLFNNIKNNLLEYLLYLFVFLLPWQVRWIAMDSLVQGLAFEYARISLYAFDILLAVLLICYFIKIFSKRAIISHKPPQIFFLVSFVVYCLASVFWADEKALAFYWAGRMLAGLVLFWLVQNINFSKIRLAVVVVISGSIQALLGIWQFINQNVWASKWLGMAAQNGRDLGTSVVEFGLERWLRAYGSLPHPNILGGFLVLSFVGVIYLLARIEHKYHKLFLIFSSSLIVLGILFSYSRSAWLAFGCFSLLGILYIYKQADAFAKKFAKWLGIYLLLLCVVFVSATLPIVKTRLNIGVPTRLEIKSNSERLAGYQQAQQIIKDNLIFGTAIGNYAFEVQKKYSDLKVWSIQVVHNVFLLVFAELGLIGLLWLIVLSGYVLKLLISRKTIFSALALACFSLLLFFDHYWWTTAMGLYILWLILALAFSRTERDKSAYS